MSDLKKNIRLANGSLDNMMYIDVYCMCPYGWFLTLRGYPKSFVSWYDLEIPPIRRNLHVYIHVFNHNHIRVETRQGPLDTYHTTTPYNILPNETSGRFPFASRNPYAPWPWHLAVGINSWLDYVWVDGWWTQILQAIPSRSRSMQCAPLQAPQFSSTMV